VAKGETLSEIAKRYGISMATIVSYNKLQSNEVKIGQELRIPARR
jgi:N-acetylmuramoyl-L-alanine amidase